MIIGCIEWVDTRGNDASTSFVFGRMTTARSSQWCCWRSAFHWHSDSHGLRACIRHPPATRSTDAATSTNTTNRRGECISIWPIISKLIASVAFDCARKGHRPRQLHEHARSFRSHLSVRARAEGRFYYSTAAEELDKLTTARVSSTARRYDRPRWDITFMHRWIFGIIAGVHGRAPARE